MLRPTQTTCRCSDKAHALLRQLLDGRAQTTGIKRLGGGVTLLIVFNAHHDVVKFSLPRCYEARGWNRLIDTNDPALPPQKFRIGFKYKATGRFLLFERVPNPRRNDGARRRGKPCGLGTGKLVPSAKQPPREDGGANSS